MRVLVVSYFFPPFNAIGAVRLGKMVKYLRQLGHEVKVLTAQRQSLQATLPLETPKDEIASTPWINVNAPVELLLGGRERVAKVGYSARTGGSRVARTLGEWYKHLINFPDGQVGWYPYAVAEGRRVLLNWRPDIIYASAMPVTALLAAHALSKRSGVPWVAELRDLWTDNPYRDLPGWRRALETRLERRVLGSASGLVTISEPLAEVLERRFSQPVGVVTNGFDPEDYPANPLQSHDNVVRIVYTGMIYEGRRDPSPLFAAIRRLNQNACRVKVDFFGRYLQGLPALAQKYGVQDNVAVHPPVSHADALRIQSEGDVLLLLLWNDPREKGSFTGKVFEYFGARRPILVIGPQDNVAARLIQERNAGVVATAPEEIVGALRTWIQLKEKQGTIPPIPKEATAGFSRREQAEVLAAFLERCMVRSA